MTSTPPVNAIGNTAAGAELDLNLDALIGSHLVVAANSGGGKSGAIRKLLETTYGQVQHIILDPEDDFYTLRERFDYVIAGGDGGDIPATVANAGDLAIAALTHGFSLIAQINDLDDAPQFIAAFLNALVSAPRELWRPVLVVIDEAQHFAPSGAQSDALPAIKNLLQRGRKRGFTAVLATTRVSELHPGARGLARNWMLGLVGQTLDRKTAAEQLGFGASSAEARGLQLLEPRQFWGFGPAIARQPVLFTVGDVETTIVKSGQVTKVPTSPAPEALREILSGLASAMPAVSDAQDTPAGARMINEGEVARLKAIVADQAAELEHLRTVDQECDGYNAGLSAIEALVVAVRDGSYRANLQQGDADLHSAESPPTPAPAPAPVSVLVRQMSAPKATDVRAFAAQAKTGKGATVRVGAPPREDASAPGDIALNQTAKEIASLLKGRMPTDINGLLWNEALFLIGRRPGSGDAHKARSGLVAANLIDPDSAGRFWATATLLKRADIAPIAEWPTKGRLTEMWSAKLRGPGGEILVDLVKNGAATRREIGERMGKSATSGWFHKGVKDLLGSNVAIDRAGVLHLNPFLSGDDAA